MILPQVINDYNTVKSLNLIDGLVNIYKFGISNLIDTTDGPKEVWNRDHDLNYISTPVPFYLTSDNVADNQLIDIIALDACGEYLIFKVNLQGFTEVLIHPTLKFLRVSRVKNANGIPTLGNVYVSTGGTLLGVPPNNNIQGWFTIADQQTQMTHFTTPANYYAVMKRLSIGILNEGNVSPTNADVPVYTRKQGGIFLNKGNIPLSSEGDSFPTQQLYNGRFIGSMTDIKFVVVNVGRNDTAITCNYLLELYRTDIVGTPIILD